MDKKPFKKFENGTVFTFGKYVKTSYKRWNDETKKYEFAQEPTRGFQKRHLVDTGDGVIDVSNDQLAQILIACFDGGSASPTGHTFKVKTNGKTGIEIRYFIDKVEKPIAKDLDPEIEEEKIPEEDFGLPF